MNDKEIADYCMLAVCEAGKTTPDNIRSKDRHRPFPNCRKALAYLMDKHTNMSLNAIAKYMNYRDHSMVIKGRDECDVVTRGYDPDLFSLLEEATQILEAYIERERRIAQIRYQDPLLIEGITVRQLLTDLNKILPFESVSDRQIEAMKKALHMLIQKL